MHWEIPEQPGTSPSRLSVFPTALLYGYSVYTSFRWPLPALWFSAHLARLAENARTLGLHWPFAEQSLRKTLEKMAIPENTALRLTALADIGGYPDCFSPTELPVRLILSTRPVPPQPIHGLKLQTVAYQRPMPQLKLGSMAEALLLKRQARTMGFDDVLFVSSAGHLREASTANLFVIRAHDLITPCPARDGCLPGITRQQVIETAARLNVPVSEDTPITPTMLAQAHGAFLTNAVQGLIPVSSMDGQTLPWPPEAHELMARLGNQPPFSS